MPEIEIITLSLTYWNSHVLLSFPSKFLTNSRLALLLLLLFYSSSYGRYTGGTGIGLIVDE